MERADSVEIENSKIKKKSKKPWLKLAIGAVVIAAVIIIVNQTGLTDFIKPEKLQELADKAGVFAPLGYILIYIVAAVFGVPGTILTLSSGAVFGPFWGTLWTVIGATLGATAAFLVSRFIAGDWAKQQFAKGDRLRKIQAGLEEEGFQYALTIRLAPIFPFNAVNYLFGLTPIPLGAYVLATAIGILPGTFAYSWLGRGGTEALA
ncbi:MAG: TVP38/TMEM64 family protein, partial [Spirulinaceae cyanobacterium]